MPGVSGIIFCAKHLDRNEVQGKRVIDVGACDFNGSIRPLIESWQPSEYIGVDIIDGPGVDQICDADNLVENFGENSFDIVLSIEMLEHTQNWQRSIANLKQVCKPGGIILITTRSYGYPCHGFPYDFWRYEYEDIEHIFSDCTILSLEKDWQLPGIFVKARKPERFVENNLETYKLLSIITNKRASTIREADFQSAYCRRLALKQSIKNHTQRFFLDSGRAVSNLLRI